MKFKTLSAAALIVISALAGGSGASADDPATAKQKWDEYTRGQLSEGYSLLRAAQTAEDKGNHAEARNLYQQAFARYEKCQKDGAPDALRCMDFVGDLYMKDSKYAEAEESYRKSLTIASKLFGTGNDKMVPNLTKIGTACFKEHKYKDAAAYLKQAYDLQVHKAGEDDPQAIGLRETLANAFERDNNFTSSEPLLVKALDVREKQGDAGSPQLLVLLDCYSDLLRKTDRPGEADRIDYKIDLIHNQSVSTSKSK